LFTAIFGIYIAFVALFVLLKLSTPLMQTTWAEVLYGPALTIASAILLFLAVLSTLNLIAGRRK
jgi:hypothetical protein